MLKPKIKLKKGFTHDPRLDRIKQFDERNRKFPIRQVVEKTPRNRVWSCQKTLDQGREGSCVGHGIAHELIANPCPVEGIDHEYAKTKIYWEAQKIDPWEGGSYPGATPNYEGTSVLCGVKVAQRLGWFEEYRWGFGLNDLVLGIGYNGPSVIGISWYEDMFTPDQSGFIHVSGSIAGGHCILVRGVNVLDKYFILHNSWGREWGSNGDCKVSFTDMKDLLADNGESCFFVHRHTKPKPK